jgi:N6-L-threonylcarbamoyladenine synthase
MGESVVQPPIVLGIETSCDETAASVVEGSTTVLSSVVSSQIALHARFGGVVPELAGRAHLERIVPVVAEALAAAGFTPDGYSAERDRRIDAVAATVGPGLVGALVVGIAAAKSLAVAYGTPFVGVNHLEGHLYAAFLEDPAIVLPAVVLLVSGGHTLLVEMRAPGEYVVLGSTVDDAAGEAFDKVARFLGLGYPGGPELEALAEAGRPDAIAFPRAMLGDGHGFSFSGLKSAVVREVRAHPEHRSADVAASFQAAVVDVLVQKALAAAVAVGAGSVCLAGGVAANGVLRRALAAAAAAAGLHTFLPRRAMCTDNAAMIAAAGAIRLGLDGPTALSVGPEPGLGFGQPRRG